MLGLRGLRRAYGDGTADPVAICRAARARLSVDPAVVITWVDLDAELERLAAQDPTLPLWGVPFVIKDNIDLAGYSTTAACPGFAYEAVASAPAVAALIAAGAVPLAKVNLDQFATGLVGTRSPYGIPRNPVMPDRIAGGSSSGSAVAVASGGACFALGTDTAGSGRIPAACCNIVGLKPTRGRVSTRGVVPACRSLDCVSVFATSVADAADVLRVIGGPDLDDSFSRVPPAAVPGPVRCVGVLEGDDLQIDEPAYGAAYRRARELLEAQGLGCEPVDYAPFARAAALLYDGPWVAERAAAVGEAIDAGVAGLDPTVTAIIVGGRRASAIDAFRGFYQLADCRRAVETIWQWVDALLLPSAPGIPTVAAVVDDPLATNSRLGTYTNFANLLDCAAVTVPAQAPDGGLASCTLVGPAWSEDRLLALATELHRSAAVSVGAGLGPVDGRGPQPVDAPATRPLAVVGAHLAGEALHGELLDRGARFQRRCRTAPSYRLMALADSEPPKPGLRRVDSGGAAIVVEVYDLPLANWGRFLDGCRAPLAIGRVELDDGAWVAGFVADASALGVDITAFGGWQAWLTHDSTR